MSILHRASILLCTTVLVPVSTLAVEPTSEELQTVTDAENIQRAAERGRQDVQPLPPKQIVESDEQADAASTPPAGKQPQLSTQKLGIQFTAPEGTESSGVEIEQVAKKSAAARVGLQEGDQVLSVGKHRIVQKGQIATALEYELRAGPRNDHVNVPMVVRRDGIERTVHWTNTDFTIAGYGPLLVEYGHYVPPQYVTGYRGNVSTPYIPANPASGFLGVELDTRYPDAAIVSRVVPGTPAAKVGLQAGDRIWGVNNERVQSVNDLIYQLSRVAPGESVEIDFDRSHHAQATLAPRKATGSGATEPAQTGAAPSENAGEADTVSPKNSVSGSQ